jgi:hypothetical protein
MFTAGALLLVVVIALAWLRFGLWSAFLHMLCVLVAGALAFALWEPIAYVLLGAGQEWLVDSAWAISLALPFVIMLLIIRVACDKIIRANLKVPGIANYIGGGLFGFIAGTISIGILTISLGYLRVEPEFMGYKPVDYNNSNGSIVQKDSLIYPVDRITAALYGKLSEGTFRPTGSSDTLARWRPEVVNTGGMLRTNFEEGTSRNTATPDSFDFVTRYRFEAPTSKELLTDAIDPNGGTKPRNEEQKFTTLDGTPITDGVIEGFVVKFKAGAKEQSGRIVIGAGQVQLVVEDPTDSSKTMALNPLAVISQASGDKPTLGRWRFDAANTFISTPSGRDESPMAFEFLVPKGANPIGLYVKNVRHDLTNAKPSVTFKSQKERDAAAINGSIVNAGGVGAGGALNRTGAAIFNKAKWQGEELVSIKDALPFSLTLQKDILKGLLLNDANMVIGGGLAKFSQNDLKGTQGLDQKLLVRRFEQPDDAVIVHVIVDRRNTAFGFLSDATTGVDWAKAPLLVDNNGATYSAVGFGYRPGAQETWIYYDPSSPIANRNDHEMPTISRSQPDQQLVLIFRVSKGVKIKSFAIGDKVVADFAPMYDAAR